MKVWMVTRHAGALEWANKQGLVWDAALTHLLDASALLPGDRVYGTLPLHLASQVCAVGAEYWHLALSPTENARGVEHSAAEVQALGGRFVRFDVKKWDTETS